MDLAALREQIDEIDGQLVALLLRRAKTAKRIGTMKRRQASPVQDKKREKQVLARVRRLCNGRAEERGIAAIYRRIIGMCTRVQRKMISDRLNSGR